MELWDEIKRNAQSMLDETSKFGRIAKLKAGVRSLESELGDRIYDLGTQVLELHRRNELHHFELDELFVEIQGLQRELREREAEMEMLLGRADPRTQRATCPDCGAKTAETDRFCRGCGATLR